MPAPYPPWAPHPFRQLPCTGDRTDRPFRRYFPYFPYFPVSFSSRSSPVATRAEEAGF